MPLPEEPTSEHTHTETGGVDRGVLLDPESSHPPTSVSFAHSLDGLCVLESEEFPEIEGALATAGFLISETYRSGVMIDVRPMTPDEELELLAQVDDQLPYE